MKTNGWNTKGWIIDHFIPVRDNKSTLRKNKIKKIIQNATQFKRQMDSSDSNVMV